MNGPEHYAEAERLIGLAEQTDWTTEVQPYRDPAIAAAQVHATLGLAAAVAAHVPTDGASGYTAWREVIKPEPPAPWES